MSKTVFMDFLVLDCSTLYVLSMTIDEKFFTVSVGPANIERCYMKYEIDLERNIDCAYAEFAGIDILLEGEAVNRVLDFLQTFINTADILAETTYVWE